MPAGMCHHTAHPPHNSTFRREPAVRRSLRFAVTLFSVLSRTPRVLVALVSCAVLVSLALFTLGRAEPLWAFALLQEESETPAEGDAVEPRAPTPEERRAEKEARVADLAARLNAGRDDQFEADLVAHIQASQSEIAAETAELGKAIIAAQSATITQAIGVGELGDRPALELAVFDTGFADSYFKNAHSRLPLPHIISINFPATNDERINSSLMPAENWNNTPVAGGGAKIPLIDDRGEPTSALLAFESQAGGQYTPLYGGMENDQALMSGGIRAWYASHRALHGPPVTIRVEGLSLAMQRGYQVYAYIGVGLSLEPGGACPFQISLGNETPLFGGGVMNRFSGEWVRIDAHNGTGNYLLTPLLAEDELLIEMAPVGFYHGIEMGTVAINAIQIVGARARTAEAEEEELARAAAAARSAQGKLLQASQQVGAAPPPAEVAPNAAARLARLAKWQERVADQMEGLRRGDYAAVISAMQQELAEVPASL